MEAGRTELVLEPEDLVELTRAVVEQFRGELVKKQLGLKEAYDLHLGPVLCDRTRAMQIITNLVSNAIKYTPEGGDISVRVTPADEKGYAQLSVADNGVGIQESDQERLFSRWFRTQEAIEQSTIGSGLGLYITRALVELHGGKIWLESRPGEGSKFHVTFPFVSQGSSDFAMRE